MLQLARGTQDSRLEAEAIAQMTQSNGGTPEQMAELQRLQANAAFDAAVAAGNFPVLETQLTQRLAASPNDSNLMDQLAIVKARLNKHGEVVNLLVRAVAANQAAGRPIPPEWRQRIAGHAYQARLPQTNAYMRELLAVAPTPGHWHDAIAIYAELSNSPGVKLDAFRLMRAAGAMNSERDYIEYGTAAGEVRSFGEVKAVFEEGLSRNLITGNAAYARDRLAVATRRITDDRPLLAGERTAALAGRDGTAALRLGDAYYGYGDYAPAAELYRAALAKGADASLANLRLGAALAAGGNRADAETALRAVTGPRADLAQLWLLWLAQPRT
jgi:tetratricopeptide (TPR) repeat protein